MPATHAPVPMLDLSREFAAIRDEVMAALEEVCASQRFILGPAVERFEQEASAACGGAYAVGCASGTDALWLALAALGIGSSHASEADERVGVITTPFSFFATVSSILRAGAQPLLADIDPRTFNLSPDSVRETLLRHKSSNPTRIAAIMPVHLYGQCAEMNAFVAIAEEFDLKIVEDAAQAFGATWNGVRAGALGDAAAFSFYPTKNLSAYGDAGLVTTRDEAAAERARMLRAHGMRQRYYHEEIGWNSRLDSIQAAILSIKLRRLDAGNARRRELAALYDELFRAANIAAPEGSTDTAEGIVLPWTDPRAEAIFHQYVIRAPRRDALRAHLTAEGIGTDIYYPAPLHLQESLRGLGYERGAFPVSERAAEEVLALPIYPDLRRDEVEIVVDAVRRFYQ